MLLRYKFVEGEDELCRIHPSFIAVFQSHLLNHASVVEAIRLSVEAYEPSASLLEKATICHFLQVYVENHLPVLAILLKQEMAIERIVNPIEPTEDYPYNTMDEVMDSIKKDKDSV